jgi:SpoU rRNA methylase family enzyme
LKIFGLPDDLRDAVQVLMCERTYLVQLVKGLIEKLLPSMDMAYEKKRSP